MSKVKGSPDRVKLLGRRVSGACARDARVLTGRRSWWRTAPARVACWADGIYTWVEREGRHDINNTMDRRPHSHSQGLLRSSHWTCEVSRLASGHRSTRRPLQARYHSGHRSSRSIDSHASNGSSTNFKLTPQTGGETSPAKQRCRCPPPTMYIPRDAPFQAPCLAKRLDRTMSVHSTGTGDKAAGTSSILVGQHVTPNVR